MYSQDRFPVDEECNKTKGCFHDCNQYSCSFVVAWYDKGDIIDMELKTKIISPGDKWIAVGFSYDKHMVCVPFNNYLNPLKIGQTFYLKYCKHIDFHSCLLSWILK